MGFIATSFTPCFVQHAYFVIFLLWLATHFYYCTYPTNYVPYHLLITIIAIQPPHTGPTLVKPDLRSQRKQHDY